MDYKKILFAALPLTLALILAAIVLNQVRKTTVGSTLVGGGVAPIGDNFDANFEAE